MLTQRDGLQACQGLLLCLPPYASLMEVGEDAVPLWETDSVLASRMQFLMSMLGPCVPQLTQVLGVLCFCCLQ